MNEKAITSVGAQGRKTGPLQAMSWGIVTLLDHLAFPFQLCECCGLDVCAPLKFTYQNPNPQCIWRWGFGRWLGLDEIVRVGFPWWNSCPYKKRRHEISPPLHTHQGRPRVDLTRNLTRLAPWTQRLPQFLQPRETNICCSSHSISGILLQPERR